LANPEQRPAVMEFESTKDITMCHGMLIDGDLAKTIEPRESAKDGSSRSGTIPFISINLLRGWSDNVPVSHTPLDDAESFTWVKLWRYLVEAEKHQVITTPETSRLHDLASPLLSAVLSSKLLYILPPRKEPAASPLLLNHVQVLLSLVIQMPTGDNVEGSFLNRYRHVYERYFTTSFQFRKQNETVLRQPWAKFFNDQRAK